MCYSRWAARREVRTLEQGLPLTWIDHPTSQQETSLSPDLVPNHSDPRYNADPPLLVTPNGGLQPYPAHTRSGTTHRPHLAG
jgi:hypothetical protein